MAKVYTNIPIISIVNVIEVTIILDFLYAINNITIAIIPKKRSGK